MAKCTEFPSIMSVDKMEQWQFTHSILNYSQRFKLPCANFFFFSRVIRERVGPRSLVDNHREVTIKKMTEGNLFENTSLVILKISIQKYTTNQSEFQDFINAKVWTAMRL